MQFAFQSIFGVKLMMKIVDETIEDIRDTITDLMFALNDKSEVAKRLVDEGKFFPMPLIIYDRE